MKKIFRKLKDIDILLKPEKYKFYKKKVKFLRFLIKK